MNSSPQSCDLCALPVRSPAFTLLSSDHTYSFCCKGCKQVFQMLAEKQGTDNPVSFKDSELFKKCQELGIIPRSEQDLVGKEELPVSKEGSIPRPRGEPFLELNLKISGMWCPACAWVIEESLKKQRGISNVQCSFSSDRMRCDYDPLLTSPARIRESVASLGYDAYTPDGAGEAKDRRREIIRFALSAFLTMNVMMFSFALYAGFFTQLSPDTVLHLSWPIFVMSSIVLFYGGRRIYQRAWAGVTSAAFSMETLITLGAFSAYIYSTYQMLSGSIHLYFDTACMLIVLVTLGKLLESRAKDKVKQGLESLFSLQPTKVKILFPGQAMGRYVSAAQLSRGDLFQVEEGEIVPADGKVMQGKATVDESSLTGEARPVPKSPGDDLRSGVRLIQGLLKVRAEKAVEDSTLSQLLTVLDKTLTSSAALPGKTDRILRWFVPLVIALAAGTGFVGIHMGLSLEAALLRSLTVLVISCPCTLGIAVPLARVAGISSAGREGILVREFSSFEHAEQLDTFVFDKTGTITRGQWTLLKIIPTAAVTEEAALALAASLEQGSEHFIARELLKSAKQAGLELSEPAGRTTFENGISGHVKAREVKIGSDAFVAEEIARLSFASPPQVGGVGGGGSGQALPSEHSETAHSMGSSRSLVYLAVDGELSAIFVFGDEIKQEAPMVIRELQTMGYRLHLVSGDGPDAIKTMGREVGITETHGGLFPEDKATFIRRIQDEGGHVAMVGDGVNDAPALVQANLGISISSGSDLGKEAGGITLMRGHLTQILDFLNLATRVNKKIRENLILSSIYNVLAIPIAMTGLLNPLIAVTAMLLSSLTVIGNTFLLIKRTR